MTAAPTLGKDLTGLEHMTPEQIRLILDTAEPFKEVSERPIKKVPALRGKTIVNLFFEASTRTRISFEFAEKRLSADTVNVAASGSAVQKGETLVDTAKNLEAMRIDMVVIRHPSSGAALFLGNREQHRFRASGCESFAQARHAGGEPAIGWIKSRDYVGGAKPVRKRPRQPVRVATPPLKHRTTSPR